MNQSKATKAAKAAKAAKATKHEFSPLRSKSRIRSCTIFLFLNIIILSNLFLFWGHGIIGYIDYIILTSPKCQNPFSFPTCDVEDSYCTSDTNSQTCENLTLKDSKHQHGKRSFTDTMLMKVKHIGFNSLLQLQLLTKKTDSSTHHIQRNETIQQMIQICHTYQKIRSYLHINKLLARTNWWFVNELHVKGIFILSSNGWFTNKCTNTSQLQSTSMETSYSIINALRNNTNEYLYSPVSNYVQIFIQTVKKIFWSISIIDFIYHSFLSTSTSNIPKNILHLDTQKYDNHHEKQNMDTLYKQTPTCHHVSSHDHNYWYNAFPPPMLEIGDLNIHWTSWKHPIVDISIHDIQFNIVIHHDDPDFLPFFLSKQSRTTTEQSNSQNVEDNVDQTHLFHTILFTMKSITIGNYSIPTILDMLPPPPEKEGNYPKMGIIHVTNVTLAFFSHQIVVPPFDPNPTMISSNNTESQFKWNNLMDDFLQLSSNLFDTILHKWKPNEQNENNLDFEKSPNISSTMDETNMILLSKLDLPDSLFFDLYETTKERKSEGGIDQLHLQNILEQNIILGVRKYLLQEEDILSNIKMIQTTFSKWWENTMDEMKTKSNDLLETNAKWLESFVLQMPSFFFDGDNNVVEGIFNMIADWKEFVSFAIPEIDFQNTDFISFLYDKLHLNWETLTKNQ